MIAVALIAKRYYPRFEIVNAHGSVVTVFGESGGGNKYADFYARSAEDARKWLMDRNFQYISSQELDPLKNGSITSNIYRGSHDGSPEFDVDLRTVKSFQLLGPGWGLHVYMSWSDYGDPTNEDYYDDFQKQFHD